MPNVVVHVGEPSKNFHVNEAVIRASSNFFDKALNTDWEEGRSRTVRLPECDEDDFGIYLNWLYFGKVFASDEKEPKDSYTSLNMVNMYILGDKLLDVDFKDAVCDAIAEDILVPKDGKTWIMNQATRLILYENTISGNPLRRLIVQALSKLQGTARLVMENDSPAFLYEMVQELLRAPNLAGCKENPENFHRQVLACAFHEHALGEGNCYRNKHR